MDRRGIGRFPIVALLVTALVVASVAGYLVITQPSYGGNNGSSTRTSDTSLSSSTSQGQAAGQVLIELGPNTIYLFPGGTENYTQLILVPLGLSGTPHMNLKLMGLPNGATGSLSASSVDLSTGSQTVTLSLSAAKGLAPGTYQLSINGVAGSINETQQFKFNVAQYIVYMNYQTYIPANMTVPSGSAVVFMNLEGRISQYDSGLHDVRFTTGSSATSPSLAQYDSWTFTFTQSGTYTYFCSFHPFMKGSIIVTS